MINFKWELGVIMCLCALYGKVKTEEGRKAVSDLVDQCWIFFNH